MTKNEKIALLINGIVMLNMTSEHKNNDIYQLAKQIGILVNGNTNFAVMSCVGATYEQARTAVKQVLKEEKIMELE